MQILTVKVTLLGKRNVGTEARPKLEFTSIGESIGSFSAISPQEYAKVSGENGYTGGNTTFLYTSTDSIGYGDVIQKGINKYEVIGVNPGRIRNLYTVKKV